MVICFASCDDDVSYSDMKERERNNISSFIRENGIVEIPFSQFESQGYVTNIENNEYVLLNDVYVQFVRNPKDIEGAKKIEDGDTRDLLVRYTEYSIQDAETLSQNIYDSAPDEMTVSNESGTYSASFASGVMLDTYGTSAVPTGWLTVMPYLYFTRSQSNLAEVNLIVPHTEGTSTAATYVYPCFYNIKFQPER